jgi:hypothetical protein
VDGDEENTIAPPERWWSLGARRWWRVHRYGVRKEKDQHLLGALAPPLSILGRQMTKSISTNRRQFGCATSNWTRSIRLQAPLCHCIELNEIKMICSSLILFYFKARQVKSAQ